MSDGTPPTKLSHDVREMLYMAEYVANKRQATAPTSVPLTTADLWWALAATARPFSVPAQVIKGLGLSSKQVKRAVKPAVEATASSTMPGKSVGYTSEQWLTLAAPHSQHTGDDTPNITLAALLAAMLANPDGTSDEITQQPGVDQAALQHTWQNLHAKTAGLPTTWWFGLGFYLRETLEIIIVMLLFLVVIKEGLGELRLIPSESMVPTLQIGDRLLIEKVSRWYRPLHRGDIMVFYPPEPEAVLHDDPVSWVLRATGFSSLFHNSPSDPVDKAYIKRLIGLPGDTVWMINNEGVMVNGKLLTEPYVNEIAYGCGNACAPIKIPNGYYLMLGDNRNQSKDGRYFGLVPKSRIMGRAVLRVWPANRFGLLGPIPYYLEK